MKKISKNTPFMVTDFIFTHYKTQVYIRFRADNYAKAFYIHDSIIMS